MQDIFLKKVVSLQIINQSVALMQISSRFCCFITNWTVRDKKHSMIHYLKYVLLCFTLIFSIIGYSQTTYNPYIESRNNYCDITSVTLTENNTIVTIKVPKKYHKSANISSATVLVPVDAWPISSARQSNLDLNDMPDYPYDPSMYQMINAAVERVRKGREMMSEAGFLIRSLGNDKLDQGYQAVKGADYFTLTMYFDRLPVGTERVYIRELAKDGWEWYGIKINNPFPYVENTGYNESSIKGVIENQNDGITGIYQGLTQTDNQYKLGCIRVGDNYKFVYLDSKENLPQWKVGDIKAVLYPTAVPLTFKMDWYMGNKTLNKDCYAIFEGATMKVFIGGEEYGYIKMYPSLSNSSSSNVNNGVQDWSGTGFAIGNGYIATNYHIVENAKTMNIRGIKGSFYNSYNAIVAAIDKNNDLAILKIDDSNFKGFGTIPYRIKTTTSDVGEDVFVLGYPLTTTMGEEIKLTTGVISSKTGFQGDVSMYQISAPVQPGNSGGPLFDGKGNIVGVVSAKHLDAENVGYAIKSSYLNNLVETLSGVALPSNNTISTLSLSEKVKKIDDFVFLITCSSKANAYNSRTNTNNSSVTRTINNPSVNRTTADRTKILKIELSKDYTSIEIKYNNRSDTGYYQWCTIRRDTYILVNGQKYTMTRAEGIKVDPEKTYFSYSGQDLTFTLFFPPIPQNSTKMDLIESPDSPWKWYGINLK